LIYHRPWTFACTSYGEVTGLMWNAYTHDTLTVSRDDTSSGTRRVIQIDPEVDSRYEAFVETQPNALIYHHPAWLQVLSRENDSRPLCLACEDSDGRLHGVLGLFETRGLPFIGRQLAGRRLSSLPRTPVAGPLASDRDAAAALLRAAAEQVDTAVGTQLQIKAASNDFDGLVDGIPGARWRPAYAIELPERVEDLRFGNSKNHARIRSTVNKAEKINLRLREADSEEDLRAWYDVYLETMRWHAVPARSFRFFKAAWDVLRPLGFLRVLLAELHEPHQTRLLAGSIFMMFGQTYFYAFNGCRRGDLSLQPNDVIQWHAIHEACRRGFRYYDLGEVPQKHDGLSFFKSKWGAQEKWLYRYYYPAPKEFESGELESGRMDELRRAIWRRLPLKATMFIGDRLYRYL
jgi:CelD/BcsL family acetyltransferase involved in cellulose biosynthesis